jgi:hypothetical protein
MTTPEVTEKISKEKQSTLRAMQDPSSVPMNFPNKEVHVMTEMPKMCRIRFYNLRDPGRELKFFLSTKTHPLHHYTLYHDREYDLPLEVVQHLDGINNNSCMVPIRRDKINPDSGVSESYIHSWKGMFQCKFIKQL